MTTPRRSFMERLGLLALMLVGGPLLKIRQEPEELAQKHLMILMGGPSLSHDGGTYQPVTFMDGKEP